MWFVWVVFVVVDVWMCGPGNVWVWCESSYGVAAFEEFMGQLTWDKWEILLEML